MIPEDFTTIPYRAMGPFLQKRFGRRTFKIGVDAGFSCPHRVTKNESGVERQRGCSFCAEEGSRSPLIGQEKNLRAQIEKSSGYWWRKYPDCGFLLYFQAFTNTFASPEVLRERYQQGLACQEFSGMIVGTRPDCVGAEVADVLQSFQTVDREVWVELGQQTIHPTSLQLLRRGHGTKEYQQAAKDLAHRGIAVIPHVIFGIPGEGQKEREETIRWLVENTPSLLGIKIHNLLLLPGTSLYAQWEQGKIDAYSMDEHLEALISVLEHIPPEVVIMRLTADIPLYQQKAAEIPGELWPSTVFTGRLQQRMREIGTWQGRRA